MGKNRNFKNVYRVTISGKTTNGFMAKVLDNVFNIMIQGLSMTYSQNDTKVEVIETKGDFNAKTKEITE